MASRVDLTGNWHSQAQFSARLQTHEPDVPEGGTQTFYQSLRLPPGAYTLQLTYDAKLDRKPGRTLRDAYTPFTGLTINGQPAPLNFELVPNAAHTHRAELPLTVTSDIHLALAVCNTRPLRTHLVGDFPAHPNYLALGDATTEGELLLAHGLPFRLRQLDIRHDPAGFHGDHPFKNLDRGSLLPWDNGMHLTCGNIRARTAHFLGMTPSIDIANGSWYAPKGDHGYSYFIGDKLGELVLHWQTGEPTTVPLILGFNLWYGRPWDMLWHYVPYSEDWTGVFSDINCDANLFCGDDTPRQKIEASVHLTDGLRLMGSRSVNARFIFSLALDERPLAALAVRGVSDHYGHPLISAITFEAAGAPLHLLPLPALTADSPLVQPVTLDAITEQAYQPSVLALMRTLYTFRDELPALAEPLIPSGYFGPRYHFTGPREAVYAATYLYYNGPECAAHIADTGTQCSSSTARVATVHYTHGIGIWRRDKPLYDGLSAWFERYQTAQPGELPGVGVAWSRAVGELVREAVAFGYTKFLDRYLDWVDDCLFTDAAPPHWIRCPGSGAQVRATENHQVGALLETGNRENDGHGIILWGRYMAWHWLGRRADWNRHRFAATRAAVEWIAYQLDTDQIFPGVRQDVLYTESECAWGSYDIYSSYNCLHGLKLSIRLAQQLGRADIAARWQRLYTQLRQGILDHLVDESEFGPVWHTYPLCDWQDHAHKLVHLQLSTEGDSYTPLQDYAQGDSLEQQYLTISRNSYRLLMRDHDYNCLRMYGYGQGMMTQAALLLDEMADAEQFINALVNHCYQPQLEGWAGPEGVIVHPSGACYVPVNGYMGQDSHVADSTKALRLMLGVDDNDPTHLRLVPRFPASWPTVGVAEWPVCTGAERGLLAYTYTRTPEQHRFEYHLQQPAAQLSVRLGPLPTGQPVRAATFDGQPIDFEILDSGDSRWVWVRGLTQAVGVMVVDLA